MKTAEQEIEDWFKASYAIAQNEEYPADPNWNKRFISPEREAQLSDEYKRAHSALIEERKAEELRQARAQASESIERTCRDCDRILPAHEGRGRPPVRCGGCRGLAK